MILTICLRICLAICLGTYQQYSDITADRHGTTSCTGKQEVLGCLVRTGSDIDICTCAHTGICTTANPCLRIIMRNQRIQGHADPYRTATANTANHINGIYSVCCQNIHILASTGQAAILIDLPFDKGLCI